MNDKQVIKALKKELFKLRERNEELEECNELCLNEIQRLQEELAKEKAFRLLLSRVIEMPDFYEITEFKLPF